MFSADHKILHSISKVDPQNLNFTHWADSVVLPLFFPHRKVCSSLVYKCVKAIDELKRIGQKEEDCLRWRKGVRKQWKREVKQLRNQFLDALFDRSRKSCQFSRR